MEQYLTQEQRRQYFVGLNKKQKETLEKYKKYRFNSELLTEFNQDGVDWKFQYAEIDEKFNIHNPQDSYLTCECGRHVKYLYICEASNGEKKGFGCNHLEQEAGIPHRVVAQVNKLEHDIDRGTDEILSLYYEGYRFPRDMYEYALKNGQLDDLKPHQQKMWADFEKVDLPLYATDFHLLRKKAKDYEVLAKPFARQKQIHEKQVKDMDEFWKSFGKNNSIK